MVRSTPLSCFWIPILLIAQTRPATQPQELRDATAAIQQRRYDAVFAPVRAYLQAHPGDYYAYWAHGLLGAAYLGQGRAAEALAELDEALRLKADYSSGTHNKITALRALQRYDEALRAADAWVREKPEWTRLNVRALVLMDLNRPQEAERDLRQAVQAEPEVVWSRMYLGDALRRQGKLDDALGVLDEALRMEPKNAESYLVRGLVWQAKGDAAKAQQDRRAGEALHPSEETLRRFAAPASTAVARPGGGGVAAVLAAAPRPRRARDSAVSVEPWRGDFQLQTAACDLRLAPARPRQPFSFDQYSADITTAMQGMALLSGAEEAPAPWAKLLEFPTEEAVAYFNRLVPLLEQFLAAREVAARGAAAFDASWAEAVAAAVAGDDAGALEALEIARIQEGALACANAKMAQIVAAVEALGNPPDPVAARRKARALMKTEAAEYGRELLGLWIGGTAHQASLGEVPMTLYFFAHRKAAGGQGITIATLEPWRGLNTISGSLLQLKQTAPGTYSGQEFSSWDGKLPEKADAELELRVNGNQLAVIKRGRLAQEIRFRRVTGAPPPIHSDAKIAEAKLDAVYSTKAETDRNKEEFRAGMRKENLGRQVLYEFTERWNFSDSTDTKTEMLECQVAANNELQLALGKGGAAAPVRRAAAPKPPAAPGPPPAQEAAKYNEAAIREHEGIVKLIQKNLAKDEQEYGAAASPELRQQLYLRVLDNRANLQAERDLIQSLKTGQYAHTRTERDDYQMQLMIYRSLEHAQAVETCRRVAAGLERQIGLSKWDAAPQLRDFAARNLTAADIARGDVAKARQVAGTVFQSVQGQWQGEAAVELGRSLRWEENIFWASTIKMSAGMLLTGLAGDAAAAVGSGLTAAQAGARVGVLYGATTGMVEGGPVEAVKQAAAFSCPAGMVASEAMSGYQKDGAAGAIKAGATAFVMGRLIDYGASRISGMMSRGAAPAPVTGMTAQELQMSVEVRRGMARGAQLVEEYKMAAGEIQAARAAGASAQTLAALEARQLAAAAKINSSYPAKLLLKKVGRPGMTGPDAQAAREVASSIDRMYRTKVDPAFDGAVDAAGFAWQEYVRGKGWVKAGSLRFRDIRNVSNVGTVNADRDRALIEFGGDRVMRVTRNGQPVPLRRAQEELQQIYEGVYQRATGQDPRKAFQTITSSAGLESYADLRLIETPNPEMAAAIRRGGWAQQGADVGRIKVLEGPGDPNLSQAFRTMESARSTAKEIEKRLVPLLQSVKADPAKVEHWNRVKAALNLTADNPVTGLRLLRARTGSDSLAEVSDLVGTATEAAVKLAR